MREFSAFLQLLTKAQHNYTYNYNHKKHSKISNTPLNKLTILPKIGKLMGRFIGLGGTDFVQISYGEQQVLSKTTHTNVLLKILPTQKVSDLKILFGGV